MILNLDEADHQGVNRSDLRSDSAMDPIREQIDADDAPAFLRPHGA